MSYKVTSPLGLSTGMHMCLREAYFGVRRKYLYTRMYWRDGVCGCKQRPAAQTQTGILIIDSDSLCAYREPSG